MTKTKKNEKVIKLSENLSMKIIKTKKSGNLYKLVRAKNNMISYYEELQYKFYLFEKGILTSENLDVKGVTTKKELEERITSVGDIMEIMGEDTPMI